MNIVVLDAVAEVVEFLANDTNEANWDDVTPDNDNKLDIMNHHTNILLSLHVPELLLDAHHLRKTVAASVRWSRLSKLKKK